MHWLCTAAELPKYHDQEEYLQSITIIVAGSVEAVSFGDSSKSDMSAECNNWKMNKSWQNPRHGVVLVDFVPSPALGVFTHRFILMNVIRESLDHFFKNALERDFYTWLKQNTTNKNHEEGKD